RVDFAELSGSTNPGGAPRGNGPRGSAGRGRGGAPAIPGAANQQSITTGPDGSFQFKEDTPGIISVLAPGFTQRTIMPADRAALQKDAAGRMIVPLPQAQ